MFPLTNRILFGYIFLTHDQILFEEVGVHVYTSESVAIPHILLISTLLPFADHETQFD